jgi:thymidine kinase
MGIHRPADRGHIEVITGPMFAGKSEELMRRVRRATIAGLGVAVVNHALDTRRGASAVSSHAGGRIPAQSVPGAEALREVVMERRTRTGGTDGPPGRTDPSLDLVAIDEAQFFGAGLVPVVVDLADAGLTVVISGLCLTFDDQPFEPLPALVSCAEQVTKLLAVCTVCGDDAAFHRRVGVPAAGVGNALVPTVAHVGGAESYQARCRRHRRV